MYSGVPQVDLDTDCTTSFLEKPKSHSLSCGRGHGPCSSMLSSCVEGTISFTSCGLTSRWSNHKPPGRSSMQALAL